MVLGRRNYFFRKVAIIGVGLIGGSLGKALKKHGLAKEIVGVSRRDEALAAAVQMQAIDQGTHDFKKAVVNADLVVLATPVHVVPVMFEKIAPHLKRGCVVTDVGSTKVSIIAAAKEKLPNAPFFVGSHPVAGSEKRGVEFSSEDLFQGATCLMTPTDETHRQAVERVKRMWTSIGAQVKTMTPEAHDQVLAYISHLPHVIAYALMATIPDEYLPLVGQGLKDTTRIAASSPEVWHDICFANAKNIMEALDACVANLGTLRKAINEDEGKILVNEFKKAKAKRDKLNG